MFGTENCISRLKKHVCHAIPLKRFHSNKSTIKFLCTMKGKLSLQAELLEK